jgi:hypothetical protein
VTLNDPAGIERELVRLEGRYARLQAEAAKPYPRAGLQHEMEMCRAEALRLSDKRKKMMAQKELFD